MDPTPSTLSFHKALITGGSGGIGRAMAESLLKQGKQVIIVGRTEAKLISTAKELELPTNSWYVLDTSKVSTIEGFVQRVTTDHPDIDCLINNAGVQRPFQFPGTSHDKEDYPFDLSKADAEIDTNIRGPMHLILHLLPFFQQKLPASPAVIMNVSSVLGYNPVSLINPVYNGTKAWMHFFSMNLRSQLANAGQNVKVVEVAPPTVETDLHRERTDPDDNKKRSGNDAALSLDEFMREVEKGWREDRDVIAPGPAGAVVAKWYDAYGEGYETATTS